VGDWQYLSRRPVKRFDLTFKGEVLPDYDPRQVKSGFAELFCIKDPNILEELFSGDRIVLRANLDRKSAAEYFHKVAQLGGKAELISSSTPIEDVSAANGPDNQLRRADPLASPTLQAQPPDTRESAATPNPKEILSRIHKLQEEARAWHQEEIKLIDRQQSAEEDKTARVLAHLREEHNKALEESGAEIKRLNELEESVLHQFRENREVILEEREDKKIRLDGQLSQLENDIARRRSKATHSEQELEKNRSETQKRAEQAIARLEKKILETRAQLERDIAELEQLRAENQQRLQSELAALKQKSETLVQTSEQELLSLDLRLEEYQQEKNAELGEICELKSHAEHSRDNQLAAIASREQELFQQEKLFLEELNRARERQDAALEQKLQRLRQEEKRLTSGESLPD
jgi:hypothetical protein